MTISSSYSSFHNNNEKTKSKKANTAKKPSKEVKQLTRHLEKEKGLVFTGEIQEKDGTIIRTYEGFNYGAGTSHPKIVIHPNDNTLDFSTQYNMEEGPNTEWITIYDGGENGKDGNFQTSIISNKYENGEVLSKPNTQGSFSLEK